MQISECAVDRGRGAILDRFLCRFYDILRTTQVISCRKRGLTVLWKELRISICYIIAAPLTAMSPVFLSLSTHTLLGDISCIARTDAARLAVMTHAFLAWAISLAALGTLLGDA